MTVLTRVECRENKMLKKPRATWLFCLSCSENREIFKPILIDGKCSCCCLTVVNKPHALNTISKQNVHTFIITLLNKWIFVRLNKYRICSASAQQQMILLIVTSANIRTNKTTRTCLLFKQFFFSLYFQFEESSKATTTMA